MELKKIRWWSLCFIAFICVVLIFTPVVMPPKVYKPIFLGLPYTMWMGILWSILLVMLTYIATIIHPEENKRT